jgi:hypothetical protein
MLPPKRTPSQILRDAANELDAIERRVRAREDPAVVARILADVRNELLGAVVGLDIIVGASPDETAVRIRAFHAKAALLMKESRH